MMHLPVGAMLGEYRITGILGQGGFSIVYLAYEASLDRTVAIKEFFPSVLAQRSTEHSVTVVTAANQTVFQLGLESFLREAKLQAKFFHPVLVEVIRVWEQNNSAYMAMRYHRGQNLRDLRRACTALRTEQIVGFIAPILDALALLHANDVIHRDVSPDNILIRETGEPVLLDLGAARTVVAGMTQSLTTVLKPGYAPIEQYADDGTLEQGPWTDVYGLAAVVYFLYVGSAPPQAVTRIVSDALARTDSLEQLPVALRPVLRRALAILPQERYRSISEFRSVLLHALNTPSVARPPGESNEPGVGLVTKAMGDGPDASAIVFPLPTREMATDKRPTADSTDDSTAALPPKFAFGNQQSGDTARRELEIAAETLMSAASERHPTNHLVAKENDPSLLPPTRPTTTMDVSPLSAVWNKQTVKYGATAAASAVVLATTILLWPDPTIPKVPANISSTVNHAAKSEETHTSNAPVLSATTPADAPSSNRLMPETPVAAVRPSADSDAKVPVQAADNESSTWKDAASAQSPFALMAYLGKYPTGKHAREANQLLRTAQRSSEGCLLRYPAVRKFSWSGRCRDGMAVGEGVLKWEAQRTNEAGISEAAGINEAHGTLKNGIMVGRWSIDLLRTSPKPLSVVNFVIEFDASGNVSRKQRRKYQNGGLYVGETDASMKNYLGNERHGVGVYTYPDNSRFKKLTGQWVDGNLSGEGKLEFADGTALSGYFLRGASGFDGVVKKLRQDGSTAESQVWRAGKPEGSKTSPIAGF